MAGLYIARLVALGFALLGLGGMFLSVMLSPGSFFAAANCVLLSLLVDLVGHIAIRLQKAGQRPEQIPQHTGQSQR